MPKKLDLTGQVFGRLTAQEIAGRNKHNRITWQCNCSCGNTLEVSSRDLVSGNTKSCGCYKREAFIKRNTKHGHNVRGNTTPTYNSWHSMIQRCTNPNTEYYHLYGGRGVKVCDRWLNSFSDFLEDMGEKPKGTELDKDIKGDGTLYSPDTCCWATYKENSIARKTTVLNEELVTYLRSEKLKGSNMSEIARDLGLNVMTVLGVTNSNSNTWK